MGSWGSWVGKRLFVAVDIDEATRAQVGLTLARFGDRVPRTKLAEIPDIPASAGPSRIDRVTLYESRLSPAGPTYVPLEEGLLILPG